MLPARTGRRMARPAARQAPAAVASPARGRGRRWIGRRHRLWRLARIDRRVLALQRCEVFTDRPFGLLLVAPVDFAARDPLVAAGVCLDHAGIDGKAFADQPDLHARRHHALEHQPKRGALTEAAMAVDRECRMVRPSSTPSPSRQSQHSDRDRVQTLSLSLGFDVVGQTTSSRHPDRADTSNTRRCSEN